MKLRFIFGIILFYLMQNSVFAGELVSNNKKCRGIAARLYCTTMLNDTKEKFTKMQISMADDKKALETVDAYVELLKVAEDKHNRIYKYIKFEKGNLPEEMVNSIIIRAKRFKFLSPTELEEFQKDVTDCGGMNSEDGVREYMRAECSKRNFN